MVSVPKASAAMECLDAVARQFERRDLLGRAARKCGVEFVAADLHADAIEIQPIEFLREILQRAVAFFGNLGDDGPHGFFDYRRGLALGVEQGAKPLGKIAGAYVEPDRHGVNRCGPDHA